MRENGGVSSRKGFKYDEILIQVRPRGWSCGNRGRRKSHSGRSSSVCEVMEGCKWTSCFTTLGGAVTEDVARAWKKGENSSRRSWKDRLEIEGEDPRLSCLMYYFGKHRTLDLLERWHDPIYVPKNNSGSSATGKDTGARETNDETISIIQVNKPEMSDRIGMVGK